MHVCYLHDPEIQRIVELPVTRYLRRETGLDCLVTFHWEDEKEEPMPGKPGLTRFVPLTRWVVAMYDGQFLLDIGEFDTGEDDRPVLDREAVQAVITRMRTLISKAEARRRMLSRRYRAARERNEMAERQLETNKKVYHDVKHRHNEKRADEYAHAAAPELIDGGPWSIKKEK